MVITCFNFMIAHPIITPNSVMGKLVYTKAADDEGDRGCGINSCHCLLSARHGSHPAKLALSPFYRWRSRVSGGVTSRKVEGWGSQACALHSPGPGAVPPACHPTCFCHKEPVPSVGTPEIRPGT